MKHPRKVFAVFLLLISAAAAQNSDQPADLALRNTDNGRRISAKVGQAIDISLGTVGPGHYGEPQISSRAVRFDNMIYPPIQVPAGPTQIFHFHATAPGEAEIKFVHTWTKATFTITIQVRGGKAAYEILDQANSATWTGGWTVLVNNPQQSFTPSLPKLTSVEVELTLANPGQADNEVILILLDGKGEGLQTVYRAVPVDDGGRVRFVFAGDGVGVSPGKTYRIRLSGGAMFGWKYTAGGYQKGMAFLNGKPFGSPGNSFLFRTFGQRIDCSAEPSLARAGKFEGHALAFGGSDDRTGPDVARIGKGNVDVFGCGTARPRCGIRLKFDLALTDPLPSVVVNLGHRGHTHEVDGLAFGIVGEQAGFLDQAD